MTWSLEKPFTLPKRFLKTCTKYLEKYEKVGKTPLDVDDVIVMMQITSKVHIDHSLDNKIWAKKTGIDIQRFNAIEAKLLYALEYNFSMASP